jgi:hypothetical protein
MFRFTIRELVLLTLVVAMGAGSWVDRQRLLSQVRSERELRDRSDNVLAKIGLNLDPDSPPETDRYFVPFDLRDRSATRSQATCWRTGNNDGA